MITKNTKKQYQKLLVRKCHQCGDLGESPTELKKCAKCNKAFLPLAYFEKVHTLSGARFDSLFSHCDDIDEEDIIKGIHVIW